MTTLFDPIQLGDLALPNRIVMAPLTRLRATEHRVPDALVVEYYRQRASAGLIISEATSVTPQGVGYANSPGIWSPDQIAGWKQVTQAVHKAGGRIVLQLWHVGRISDPVFLDNALPVAPSAIAARGNVSLLRPERPFVTPRALEAGELAGVVEAFRKGAENARAAGFDGVEVHGANGYLLDQFLQDGANHRWDAYGGSIANRARLLLQVTDACASVWGSGRVGVHLSPRGDLHAMGDSDPFALFTYVAAELGQRKLAFLCVREHTGGDRIGPQIKAAFGGRYIVNEGFTKESALQAIEGGEADAVAFGRQFLANPDLPRRFQLNAPINEGNPKTFYVGDAVGYTDYPSLESKSGTA